jgi:hypothetical protein
MGREVTALVAMDASGQHRGVARLRLPTLVVLTSLVTPVTAHAELVARPSAAAAFVTTEGQYAGGAYGTFTGGYNLELEPLLIMPELSASLGGFGGDFTGFGARVLGGVRVGGTLVVEPALILRGGYGHATITDGPGLGLNGGTFQTGIGVDYRTSRELTIGGEVLYDVTGFPTAGTTQVMHTVLLGGSVAFWL